MSLPESKLELADGGFMSEMQNYWFFGGPEYDKLCQNFAPAIRKVKEGELVTDEWQTVDGKLSQLILCDQLSRNAFRGTQEAYAYDELALDIARDLTSCMLVDSSSDTSNTSVEDGNIIYGSYGVFCVLAFMHSEVIEDHETALKLLDWCEGKSPGFGWGNTRHFEMGHYKILKRFGRYPHRNDKLGRESTPEEVTWLASDEVPGWAKSQN